MVGVTWYGDTDSYTGFVERHGLTFPQIRDDNGRFLFSPYGITGQPAFAFIDTDGEGRVTLGPLDAAEIDAQVESMLAD